MNDFKPYQAQPDIFIVKCTREEALLVQKLRTIKFGSVKIHVVDSKLIRTETTDSEILKDKINDEITIAEKPMIEGK